MWRKSAKHLRYQVELLKDCWPPPLKAFCGELHRLTDLLGEDHDLAALRQGLAASEVPRDALKALRALIDRRQAELRARAERLGRRLYAERPAAFARRMKAYWKAWDAAKKEPGSGPRTPRKGRSP